MVFPALKTLTDALGLTYRQFTASVTLNYNCDFGFQSAVSKETAAEA